jgi:hypothetical protein
MPSKGNASESGDSKAKENIYLSEDKKKKRRLSNVPSSSCSCKSSPTKKHCNSDIDLDWDETLKDAFVTDVEVADLKKWIQVENPFAFGK